MGYKALLTKADHNSELGEYAEEKEYFDVAISRYYYALYEKAIYIAKKRNFYLEPKTGLGSHETFINHFTKNVSSKLKPEELRMMGKMKALKRLRVIADYKEESMENISTYNLKFKYYFNSINSIFDRLIG
ncbi:MAG: hypothetical protein PHT79_11010 [Syntrophomonadaceae bacterium]|nr:hypothetical protein [Syntrophomonadaceae bacterium]